MNTILIRLSKMEKDMETWQKEKEEWEKDRTKWEEEKIAMQAQMETMKDFTDARRRSGRYGSTRKKHSYHRDRVTESDSDTGIGTDESNQFRWKMRIGTASRKKDRSVRHRSRSLDGHYRKDKGPDLKIACPILKGKKHDDPDVHIQAFEPYAELKHILEEWGEYFPHTLKEAAKKWYYHYPASKLQSYRKLKKAFILEYTDDRGDEDILCELQKIKQGKLSIKKYTQKIKELTRRLNEPPSEKRMRTWFLSGFNNRKRREQEVPAPTKKFTKLVHRAIKLEQQAKKEKSKHQSRSDSNTSASFETEKSNNSSSDLEEDDRKKKKGSCLSPGFKKLWPMKHGLDHCIDLVLFRNSNILAQMQSVMGTSLGSKFATEDCDETHFKRFCSRKGQKSLEAMADWEEEKWSTKLKKEFVNTCKRVWHLESMIMAFMMSHQVKVLRPEADKCPNGPAKGNGQSNGHTNRVNRNSSKKPFNNNRPNGATLNLIKDAIRDDNEVEANYSEGYDFDYDNDDNPSSLSLKCKALLRVKVSPFC
ncbi:hypothetical protein L7F22_063397 [Adiantum nelumboides]|nr:hypothetical protein [Adiantum nelumboides]